MMVLMVMMVVLDCDDGSTGGDLIIYNALYLPLFIKFPFIMHRNRSLRLLHHFGDVGRY